MIREIDESNDCYITVNVHPNSKESKITFLGDNIEIYLKAQAQKGKANKELIVFISQLLDIKKNKIELIKGHKSKLKTLLLKDCDIESIEAKLTALN